MSMALLGAGLGVDAPAVGGSVTDITNNGSGFARVRTTTPHEIGGLVPVTIAGCDVAWYNQTHTITEVIGEDSFDTDVEYTADGNGGTWSLA